MCHRVVFRPRGGETEVCAYCGTSSDLDIHLERVWRERLARDGDWFGEFERIIQPTSAWWHDIFEEGRERYPSGFTVVYVDTHFREHAIGGGVPRG